MIAFGFSIPLHFPRIKKDIIIKKSLELDLEHLFYFFHETSHNM